MITDEMIARINELYHKQKTTGLSEEEQAEQASLRKEYVLSVRKNMKATLENVVVEYPDGSTKSLKEAMKGNGTNQ